MSGNSSGHGMDKPPDSENENCGSIYCLARIQCLVLLTYTAITVLSRLSVGTEIDDYSRSLLLTAGTVNYIYRNRRSTDWKMKSYVSQKLNSTNSNDGTGIRYLFCSYIFKGDENIFYRPFISWRI